MISCDPGGSQTHNLLIRSHNFIVIRTFMIIL